MKPFPVPPLSQAAAYQVTGSVGADRFPLLTGNAICTVSGVTVGSITVPSRSLVQLTLTSSSEPCQMGSKLAMITVHREGAGITLQRGGACVITHLHEDSVPRQRAGTADRCQRAGAGRTSQSAVPGAPGAPVWRARVSVPVPASARITASETARVSVPDPV